MQQDKKTRTSSRRITETTLVIGNGPSSIPWRGIKHSPMIGCNKAIFDFDLDHCVIIDRLAIAEIISQLPSTSEYWTKKCSLELPKGFKNLQAPGIDSGSLAIELAHKLYPSNHIVCVGFDGVLAGISENNYTYKFRNRVTKPNNIHQQHRKTIIELSKKYPIKFVGISKDPELEVISYEQAISLARIKNR